jgi:RIO kinase 1
MNSKSTIDFDEFDDDEPGTRSRGDTRRPYARMTRKMSENATRFKRDQTDARTDFKFTYEPARFEEWWLLASLGEFYEHRWINDVLQRVKSGKEASVYQCRAGAAISGKMLAAAKVYRPWSLRNMRNDHEYRQGRADLDAEGRVVIDDGMLHAMEKKTEYGRQLLHQSWMAYEFRSLKTLRAAGADVPEPYAMAQNAILMGFIGDSSKCAPTLHEVKLEPGEARRLFERVLGNIDILLAHERVHGDLSAYNILYWKGDICLIDFPQVVSPRQNKNAYAIFQRDVMRVCEYFARQGVRADAAQLAKELWQTHGHQPGQRVEEDYRANRT